MGGTGYNHPQQQQQQGYDRFTGGGVVGGNGGYGG